MRHFLVIVRATLQEMDGIVYEELEYKCQTKMAHLLVHT